MLKEDGKKIGVLSLQGGIKEHLKQIELLGHKGYEVKKVEDLDNIQGIILPGGESTTIGKLLEITGLKEELIRKIEKGLPTWGTCAGMILLARNIENEENKYISLLDVTIKRNAFGRQIDSFINSSIISEVSNEPIELVFIRAPYITDIGDSVKILLKLDEKIVAVEQGNIIATSFHPELTDNLAFMKYFCSKI